MARATWRGRDGERVGLLGAGRAAATVALAVASLAGRAAAHDVSASRFDAPLPFPLLLAGAAATVVATAWFTVRGNEPATREGVPRFPDPPSVVVPGRIVAVARALASLGFLVAAGLALGHGVTGPTAAAENAATLFVWPVWLRGLAILAALVGSPWAVLSPWRTLYRGLCRLEGDRLALVGDPPDWLGHWPATAVVVVAVGVLASLSTVPLDPRATSLLVAAYALVLVVGATLFGPGWLRRADAFDALYGLFGRVAPVARVPADRTGNVRPDPESGGAGSVEPGGEATDGGETTGESEGTNGGATDLRLALRFPWTGTRRPVPDGSLVALAVAAVYAVSFDGFVNTPAFRDALAVGRDLLGSGEVAALVLFSAGLASFLLAFAAVAALGEVAGGGDAREWLAAARALAPTLVPIAVAYEVAHNVPYVAASAGRLATVTLRTLGVDAGVIRPLAWLPVQGFWVTQVLLIVAGHAVAVVAAHGVARRRYGGGRAAIRGHVPLLVVMVGYTVLSLWIVSRPVVAF